jgi:glucosyl-3-phosphoglycerate synthase
LRARFPGRGAAGPEGPSTTTNDLAPPKLVNVSLPDRAAGASVPDRERALAAWRSTNSLPLERYPVERLLELKRATVSVVLPARDVADTVGAVVGALVPLERLGLIDELLVLDAASEDGTAAVARERGAAVLQESGLLPGIGPSRGKGDALWRGLAATSGEIVAYADTDTRNFGPHFVSGLLGPLFERPEVQFVKGTFRRPFKADGVALPDEGGRVTELVARPLLNLFMPELGAFGQPLAGETAGRRALLESLPYPVGYGVEIAMMVDVARAVGTEAMAEVHLGTRQNRHQPLRDLSAMAFAVLGAAAPRFGIDGDAMTARSPAISLPCGPAFELREVSLEERPPLATLDRAEVAAARELARAARNGRADGRPKIAASGTR